MPAAPPVQQGIPTAIEQWYLDCLAIWIRYYKRTPRIHELAAYTGRSCTATYSAMTSLAHKGHVRRDRDKRFFPVDHSGRKAVGKL